MSDSSTNTPTVVPKIPSPNQWPDLLPANSEPILLYQGKIQLEQQDVSFQAETKIILQWLPLPRLRFEVTTPPPNMHFDLGEFSFRLEDGTEIPHGLITEMQSSINLPDTKSSRSSFAGIICDRVVRSSDSLADYALFLLPNFNSPYGQVLAYGENSLRRRRQVLTADHWQITVDAVDKYEEAIEFLSAHASYAITHVGCLKRTDNKPFEASEAHEILDSINWYCSFAQGRWTGTCLMKGFDQLGSQCWETWEVKRIKPYSFCCSWMDSRQNAHFEDPFPGFFKHWKDDFWKEIIIQAIHWHIEANAKAGSIEGSIILTQTAFELLSSVVLVENDHWLSPDGFDKLAASDRIRLLFRWAGVPMTIPSELNELTRLAKEYKWSDIPTAMTFIRNTITHPTKKNREKYDKHSSEARAEVWKLGLWCLELCLLKLFGYGGSYSNRITAKCVKSVTPVPWATADKP